MAVSEVKWPLPLHGRFVIETSKIKRLLLRHPASEHCLCDGRRLGRRPLSVTAAGIATALSPVRVTAALLAAPRFMLYVTVAASAAVRFL
jgi:hypothetical protein